MSVARKVLLPVELLAHVVRLLHNDKPTLVQLCLTSHIFRSLATPYLYRSFRQPDCRYQNQMRLFCSYVQTVIGKPELARHVKTVSLRKMDSHGDEHEWAPLPKYIIPVCAERIDKIGSCLLTGSVTDQLLNQWHEQMQQRFPHGILTVLLCSLPNLEKLYFEEGLRPYIFHQILDAVAMLFSRPYTAGSALPEVPFSRLHTVRTVSRDFEYGWLKPEGLCQLFNLLALGAFEIAGANGPWQDDENNGDPASRWRVARRSSPVTRLSFQHSSLTESCLRKITGSCAHPREFHFTFGLIQMHEEQFTPMELLQVLLPHAGTLEVLGVDFNTHSWRNWYGKNASRPPFGPELRELIRLKKLSVSFCALLSVVCSESDHEVSQLHLPNLLPTALEELEIVDCDPHIVRLLRELSDARADYTRLRRVRCTMLDDLASLPLVAIPGVDVEYGFFDQEARENRASLYKKDKSLLFHDDDLLRSGW